MPLFQSWSPQMSTKPCKECCEPIQLAAKRCPHCYQLQSPFVTFLRNGGAVVFFLAILAFMVYQSQIEKKEFKDYTSKVIVGSSTVHVEGTDDMSYVSCLTIAKNDSPVGLRDLQVEAKFYDANGQLIDVTQQRLKSSFLPANGEAGVRVLERAARSASAYQRCELRILDAVCR